MWINCEHVELSIIVNTEQILKSKWNTIEIQTNLNQRLLINKTHWSIEFNYSSFFEQRFLI
jgi:hypothetical protein